MRIDHRNDGRSSQYRRVALRLAFATLATITALTACRSLERSRTLGDAAVPPHVIAEQVCANCHGLGGNAVSPAFPNLAGQPAAYLVAQLKAFQARRRADPAAISYMWGLSTHLNDAQIRGLADYYAAQIPRRAAGRPMPELVNGKEIYQNGIPFRGVVACSSCHGAQAEGIAAFPRLAGQHADYLIKQLTIYQHTMQRPDGAAMKLELQSLTESDVRNVSLYLAALAAPVKPPDADVALPPPPAQH